ncbi:MAG TPA: SDR family oxidoreductase [Stellaceae bacterium]|nr:SDR family oxidoreductase [Stellaceae bacterium]
MAALAGKICVITGATSGIGLVTAERLAAMGARLVLVGRDRQKGEATLARLGGQSPRASVEILYGDLSLLAEVRRLAAEIAERAPHIDVLVNNAGAIFRNRGVTEDGFERTFALNHLAYFLLTALLRERMASPARIVNVASEAHRGVQLDLADLQGVRAYDGWTAYRRSKLCNILFTRALARRLAGSGVSANCLHPGFVATGFGDNNVGMFRTMLRLAKRTLALSPQQGAETSVYLAASPEVEGTSGLYYEKCRPRAPSPAAQDDAAAERLWGASAKLAGLLAQ